MRLKGARASRAPAALTRRMPRPLSSSRRLVAAAGLAPLALLLAAAAGTVQAHAGPRCRGGHWYTRACLGRHGARTGSLYGARAVEGRGHHRAADTACGGDGEQRSAGARRLGGRSVASRVSRRERDQPRRCAARRTRRDGGRLDLGRAEPTGSGFWNLAWHARGGVAAAGRERGELRAVAKRRSRRQASSRVGARDRPSARNGARNVLRKPDRESVRTRSAGGGRGRTEQWRRGRAGAMRDHWVADRKRERVGTTTVAA